MTPTKDQQAQEYADTKVKENYGSESNFEWMHIKQAYSDGYTACEQSMWRSVKEIPEENRTLIVAYLRYDGSIKYAYIAYYQNGVFYDEYDEYRTYESFSCWMYLPIPSHPDTNTQKI